MKLLLVGDFHGKLSEKLKKEAKKADAILSVGDYANADKIRKIIFANWGEKWFEIIGESEAIRLERESFKSGLKVLKELNKLGKKVYLVFGNSDFYEKRNNKLFVGNYKDKIKKMKNLIIVDKKIHKIGNIEIIGYGGYVDSTEYIKNPVDDDKQKQEERIRAYNKDRRKLKKLVKAKKEFIFLSHYPLYKIMDKIKYKGSPMNNKHIGFLPYNEVIKKNKPILAVCGHMHEYQGIKKLGKSLVINPCAAFLGKAALINIDEQSKRVKSIEFVR